MIWEPHLARIVNLYLFTIIGVIFFLLSMLVILPASNDGIPIQQGQTFDSSTPPKWITHLTDIHFAPFPEYKEHVDWTSEWMKTIATTLKPSVAVLTGDLADNYKAPVAPAPSYPIEDHWKLYQEKMIKGFGQTSDPIWDTVVELPGNHDVWGIYEDTENLFFKKYLHTPRPNSWANGYSINGVYIATFLPVTFPTGHGPQQYVAQIRPEHMDELEKILEDAPPNLPIVLLVHFNYEFMWPRQETTKTKLDYGGLLRKYKVKVVLAGHTHPVEHFEPLHHSGTIEVVGIAQKVLPGLGVLSIDNNQIAYRNLAKSDKYAIITYPCPYKHQIGITTANKFKIRIIAFDDTAGTSTYTVTGAIEKSFSTNNEIDSKGETGGSAAGQKIRLYESAEIPLDNGIHKIHIEGPGINDDLEFAIGVSIAPFKESRTLDFNVWAPIANLVIAGILNIAVVIGILMPRKWISSCVDAHKWMSLESDTKHWILSIFTGPFLTGVRIGFLPYYLWIMNLFIALWPLVFPTVIYYLDGKVSTVWFYGYITNGLNVYDIISQLLMWSYWLPISVALNSLMLVLITPFSVWLVTDLILVIIAYAIGMYVWYTYGADIASNGLWASSLGHFLLPIIVILLVIVMHFIKVNKRTVSPSVGDELSDKKEEIHEMEELDPSSSGEA